MTDEEFIAEWNTNGCHGCCVRWGWKRSTYYKIAKRLRESGYSLVFRKPGPSTKSEQHELVKQLRKTMTLGEICEHTGMTYGQVNASARVVMRQAKGGKHD